MTEAERYLDERLKRAAVVKSGVPAAGGEQKPFDATELCQKPVEGGGQASPTLDNQGGRGSGGGGGKVWGVVMGVFAILMTMFWMAVFKGGCR